MSAIDQINEALDAVIDRAVDDLEDRYHSSRSREMHRIIVNQDPIGRLVAALREAVRHIDDDVAWSGILDLVNGETE